MSTKAAANRARVEPEGDDPPAQQDRKLSLLVIEDDENISTAIGECFSRAG